MGHLVAMALQADGWILRSTIIWHKKSCMPESTVDRPTNSWEPIFLLAKSAKYFYDCEAVREKTGNEVSREEYAELLQQERERGEDWYQRVNGRKDPNATGLKSGMKQGGISPPGGRNQRNVWHLGPEPYSEAHFATFPTEVPRRAIKAGTSEKGCCPQCYTPWVRVTERTQLKRERPNQYVKRTGEEGTGNSCANDVAGVKVETIGWKPGCQCGREYTVPCTVLDPFSGSGTTGQVARELDRRYVGIDLNAEYLDLSKKRLTHQKAGPVSPPPRADL